MYPVCIEAIHSNWYPPLKLEVFMGAEIYAEGMKVWIQEAQEAIRQGDVEFLKGMFENGMFRNLSELEQRKIISRAVERDIPYLLARARHETATPAWDAGEQQFFPVIPQGDELQAQIGQILQRSLEILFNPEGEDLTDQVDGWNPVQRF